MKNFFLFLGIAACCLSVGCNQSVPDEVNIPTKTPIGEVRGDTLGMSMRDYIKKHPEARWCAGVCVVSDTYAGLSATKETDFTNDGNLWKITYLVDPFYANELLSSIKEKYGASDCVATQGHRCSWTNGNRTIRFSSVKNGATVDFIDEQLSEKWRTQYEAERAAQRKKDQ